MNLQTKILLAEKVKPLVDKASLYPMLNVLYERPFISSFLEKQQGEKLTTCKIKAVFSQSVIISLIFLWKSCQIPPPRLIYGSLRIPGSVVLSLLHVLQEPAQCPACFPPVFLCPKSDCNTPAKAGYCKTWAQAGCCKTWAQASYCKTWAQASYYKSWAQAKYYLKQQQ